jgi:hypothetical protein
MIANLPGVRWNISVVLICLSFTTKDVEDFLMYLFAISTSFDNCLKATDIILSSFFIL